jgi:hypothetical protein
MLKTSLILGLMFLIFGFGVAYAQNLGAEKSPASAMLRSLVVPGWGQYYVDKTDWSRGRIHLMADVTILSSYFGIELNTARLESNRNTFAMKHAGIDLSQHSRNVRLYVSEFNSVQEYNDFQERTRNWNLIIQQSDAINWHWDDDSRRNQFTSLNNRIDQQRQQLPALLTLMLVNRVLAGVHAYTQAMDMGLNNVSFTVTQPYQISQHGFQANLRIGF